MKTIGKHIALFLLFSLSLNLGFNGAVSAPVLAATTTQQQKAKEAAKKKKQKEAEKRKKEQQKAKEKAAKQAKPTKEEAYQQKVAEIEKYNAYVTRYMSRDITHRVGLWAQVGYSNLLPQGIQYNKDNQTGFDVNSKGGVGGGGGVGYQMRYKRLLLTTGIEMQVYTSLWQLSTTSPGVVARSFYMKPYQDMLYNYAFANTQDKLQAGFVQIPLLAGMEFANKYAYFLAGPKIGIGVLGSSVVSSSLTTSITDLQAIDPYQNIPSHALVSGQGFSTTTTSSFNLNLALYGEVGMSLDPWLKLKQMSTRLAVFAEYGLMNIQSTSNLKGQNDQPVDYTRVLNGGHPVQDIAMGSALSTTTAAQAKVNPLLVGVKATCWFNLPRKELKLKNLPKEPLPTLQASVVNADNGSPLMGAMVSISTANGLLQSKTTNGKGFVSARLAKGDYTLTASKVGFYTDSVLYSLTRDMRDTLCIRLRPEPVPVVYTLAGRIWSKEDHRALEAEVQLTDMQGAARYAGASTDEGLFVTSLLQGQYIAHLRCPGYMPLDDTIQFVQDTLPFYLTRIKEGIKVKINNLYFATNRTNILPQSEAALQDLTQFLLDNLSVHIRITGHTDNVGSDQANQILSEGRANSLRLELIKRGVDAARIEAEGKGESEPIDTNDTEEGRQNNRRVEFVITTVGDADIQQVK